MTRLLMLCCLVMMSWVSVAETAYGFKEKSTAFLVTEYQSLRVKSLPVSSVSAVLAAPASAWQDNKVERFIELEEGKNWLKVPIANHHTEATTAFINVANRNAISEVKIFYIDQRQDPKILEVSLRNNDTWSTSIPLPAFGQSTVFIVVDTDWPANIQIKLKKEAAFVEATFDAQFTQGFAIGGMLCLSVAALLLYFGTGNAPLMWLFAFFITRTVLLTTTMGNNLFYLFPDYPELRAVEYPVLGSISAVFYMLFIERLFNLKKNLPNAYRYLKTFSLILVVYIPLSLLLDTPLNYAISGIMHFAVTSSIVVIGWQLYKRQVRLSLAITIISAVQLILGILYYFSYTYYWFEQAHTLMFVGFWLHNILVVFLLSKQYRHQIQDKQLAQKEALAQVNATKKAQEELLALQNTTQEELEMRVQERTFELNIALQELEQVNQELEEKNTSDELTSLYNRRFYDQKIMAEFRRSKRNLTPLSLVLIDIDYFKQVNDEYGHLGGDKSLIAVAALIKLTTQRSTDIACRYGGEEFCIILPETDEEGAMAIAEKLRQQVEEHSISLDEHEISLTISCGISTYRQESFATVETLFSCADKALYRAKNEGRNQIQFLPLNLDK